MHDNKPTKSPGIEDAYEVMEEIKKKGAQEKAADGAEKKPPHSENIKVRPAKPG
jgi:hypothetical protein